MGTIILNLWLIAGVIIGAVTLISIGFLVLEYFLSGKMSPREYINKKMGISRRHHKARNENPRPIFKELAK